jgi:hypothetical protein
MVLNFPLKKVFKEKTKRMSSEEQYENYLLERLDEAECMRDNISETMKDLQTALESLKKNDANIIHIGLEYFVNAPYEEAKGIIERQLSTAEQQYAFSESQIREMESNFKFTKEEQEIFRQAELEEIEYEQNKDVYEESMNSMKYSFDAIESDESDVFDIQEFDGEEHGKLVNVKEEMKMFEKLFKEQAKISSESSEESKKKKVTFSASVKDNENLKSTTNDRNEKRNETIESKKSKKSKAVADKIVANETEEFDDDDMDFAVNMHQVTAEYHKIRTKKLAQLQSTLEESEIVKPKKVSLFKAAKLYKE